MDRAAAPLPLVEGELPLKAEVVEGEGEAVAVAVLVDPDPEVLMLVCIDMVVVSGLMVVAGPVPSVVVSGLLLTPARQEWYRPICVSLLSGR